MVQPSLIPWITGPCAAGMIAYTHCGSLKISWSGGYTYSHPTPRSTHTHKHTHTFTPPTRIYIHRVYTKRRKHIKIQVEIQKYAGTLTHTQFIFSLVFACTSMYFHTCPYLHSHCVYPVQMPRQKLSRPLFNALKYTTQNGVGVDLQCLQVVLPAAPNVLSWARDDWPRVQDWEGQEKRYILFFPSSP